MLEHVTYCFPGGRHRAITLSYDDGKVWDRRLVEILNTYGLKATFNLNGGKFGRDSRISADEVAELYAGHEVAAHSLTHPTLTRCPQEMLVQQIIDDRKRLEDLVGYPVRGFAYPNGQQNERLSSLLPNLGIAYARSTVSTRQFTLPDARFAWHPTLHHREDLLALGESFLHRDKPQHLDLLYIWGHSIDFENEDNWQVIETFARMAGRHADIWYASNIDVIDYLDALERLQFTADSRRVHNPSALSVWLRTDSRTPDGYCQQIIEVPGGAHIKLA
ncbi:polysaccharide deacetylase family protein [Viridibacterium curvum]|uniref:Polysaccharide deacetylase family protein n=1 Tax=Viridibacterium curvum TaxID=1101404 RepID=A0ABP9QV17_9RHOO